MSACVAGNGSLPRASRGHPKPCHSILNTKCHPYHLVLGRSPRLLGDFKYKTCRDPAGEVSSRAIGESPGILGESECRVINAASLISALSEKLVPDVSKLIFNEKGSSIMLRLPHTPHNGRAKDGSLSAADGMAAVG